MIVYGGGGRTFGLVDARLSIEQQQERQAQRARLMLACSIFDKHVARIDRIVHGGARGADSIFGAWSRWTSRIERVFAADWDRHGKAAGGIRNSEAIGFLVQCRTAGEPVAAILAPGGTGTNDAMRKLKKAEIEIYDLERLEAMAPGAR